MLPEVKSNDTTQTSDGQKMMTDAESSHKTSSEDQTLASPKPSSDSLTLPPLIPDTEKEKT